MGSKIKGMKTIETKVYTLDELSDDAKDKARDWAREFVCDYEKKNIPIPCVLIMSTALQLVVVIIHN